MVQRMWEVGLQLSYCQQWWHVCEVLVPDRPVSAPASWKGLGQRRTTSTCPWWKDSLPSGSDPAALFAHLASCPAFKNDPAIFERLQTQQTKYQHSLVKPREPHGEVQLLYRTTEQKRSTMHVAAEKAIELQLALDQAQIEISDASQ